VLRRENSLVFHERITIDNFSIGHEWVELKAFKIRRTDDCAK